MCFMVRSNAFKLYGVVIALVGLLSFAALAGATDPTDGAGFITAAQTFIEGSAIWPVIIASAILGLAIYLFRRLKGAAR
jgi:hypothetical protein